MAKSGKYNRIHLNRALSTATDDGIASHLRPDITGIRKSGLIDLMEVRSPGQSIRYLRRKVNRMKGLLGDLAGPRMDVIVPR